jgi:NAD(P)-dependent dehydrogenase (short-subunit alcohol dehydrogenase family)
MWTSWSTTWASSIRGPSKRSRTIEWFDFFETNVMSGVRLSRHYLPAMKARNWGRIVFISSESGICPPAEMVHYGMSKSAQLSVARGMAETCTAPVLPSIPCSPARPAPKGSRLLRALAEEQGVSLERPSGPSSPTPGPTSIIKRLIDPAEVAAWSPMSAARCRRPPMARPCGSKAAWCAA